MIAKVIEIETNNYYCMLLELFTANLSSEDALALGNLIGTIRLIKEQMAVYQSRKDKEIDTYISLLMKKHPILSRNKDWVRRQRNDYIEIWEKRNPIDACYDQISQKMTGQEKLIFDKRRQIQKSDEFKSTKETWEKTKEPGKEYKFGFRIPSHKKWKIELDHGYYKLDKYYTLRNRSTYPGWRIVNSFLRLASYFYNGNFHLLQNIFFGSFGLRSLYGFEEFTSGYDINSSTGTLKEIMDNKPWFGRLKNLYESISQSRNDFESKPDNGLLGKGITRIFNWSWNYLIKAPIGTFLLFFGIPLLVFLNVMFSGLLVTFSPAWAPLGSLIVYLFNIMIFDTESPNRNYLDYKCAPIIVATLWKFLFAGIGQFILVTLTILKFFLQNNHLIPEF